MEGVGGKPVDPMDWVGEGWSKGKLGHCHQKQEVCLDGGRVEACPPQSPSMRKAWGRGSRSRQRPEYLSGTDGASLSGAARAQGGGTRPVPPARGKRNWCTSSSWSSCGMWWSLHAVAQRWWLGDMAWTGFCRETPLGWGFLSTGPCWEKRD